MIQTDLIMLPLWALGCCMAACTIVVPMIAWGCEIVGQQTQKMFWDKFASQSLKLVKLSLAGLLAVLAVPVFTHFHELAAVIKNVFWVQMALGLSGLFALFLFLYEAGWKKCRKQKGAHIFLGGCTVLLAKAAFWTACYAALQYTEKTDLILQRPFSGASLGVWFVLLGAAIAFACVGLFVLLRRNKDDFGRDYYRFALCFSFKWALVFFVFHFSAYLFPDMDKLPQLTQGPLLPVLIFAMGTGAGTIWLWKRIACHANPVAQKSAAVLGIALLYGFICASLLLQTSRLNKSNLPLPETASGTLFLLQSAPRSGSAIDLMRIKDKGNTPVSHNRCAGNAV